MFPKITISLKLREAEFHQEVEYDFFTAVASLGSLSHKSGILEVEANRRSMKMKKLTQM